MPYPRLGTHATSRTLLLVKNFLLISFELLWSSFFREAVEADD